MSHTHRGAIRCTSAPFVRTSLVDIIDEIMRDFSKTLILDLKARVLPNAPYFDAFELINPTAPDKPVI